MHDDDDLTGMSIKMTGSIILSLIWTLLVSTLLFALAGCGGGGDDPPGNGRLDLSVTDAPVDDASSVVVQFRSVAFKRQGEAAEVVRDLTPSPRQLDLLEYQEGRAALLLDGVTLPAGRYEMFCEGRTWVAVGSDVAGA